MKVNNISTCNPSFQKLNIMQKQQWNQKILDAVMNSEGIKKISQKHDINLYEFYSHNMGYSIYAEESSLKHGDRFLLSNYEENNIASAIEKIKNFDAKIFEKFVENQHKLYKAVEKLSNQKIA